MPKSRQIILPKKAGYTPDYVALLQHVMCTKHAVACLANGKNVDIGPAVDIFMPQNMIQPATAFLLDALKDDQTSQSKTI